MFDEDEPWHKFLTGLAAATGRPGRLDPDSFVARNFLLDEGIPPRRAASYRDVCSRSRQAAKEEWKGLHEIYLAERVHRESPGDSVPTTLDPGDEDACPETFRFIDPASPFLTSDSKLHLVRVETLSFIARGSHQPSLQTRRAEVRQLAEAVISRRNSGERRRLEDLLKNWAQQIELRPVYAGYLDDLLDLFGDTPAQDAPGWPDTLRDRLGLMHLDPASRRRPIEILVFRYPVAAVPKLKRSRNGVRRPLVPPTVLDGSHSAAFLPAPRGSLTGHAVDLAAEVADPFREVLHPSIAFRARHLWRVGTIEQPVDLENLPAARGLHILRMRKICQRPDYAESTDQDLL